MRLIKLLLQLRLFSAGEMTKVSFAFCVIPPLDSTNIVINIYIYINKKLSLYLKDVCILHDYLITINLFFVKLFFPRLKRTASISFHLWILERVVLFHSRAARGGVVKSRFHCPRFQFQRGGLFAGQYTLKKRVA